MFLAGFEPVILPDNLYRQWYAHVRVKLSFDCLFLYDSYPRLAQTVKMCLVSFYIDLDVDVVLEKLQLNRMLTKLITHVPSGKEVFYAMIAPQADSKKLVMAGSTEEGTMPADLSALIKTVWADEGVKSCFERANMYDINDPTS